ncbi:MAG: hypothetical protein NT154_01370 [Verrucomicrobia bacterium]|nr:hypothetical protein [Verrucomicrobiota bacterium]
MKTRILLALAGLLTVRAEAQSFLFDFDNAPLQSSLPIDLTVGGITAHLSATGAGYSIQSTTTAAVVPVGFSGRFIYPSSINVADLLVSFSTPLTGFSNLYASQELACDSSATMRVTAYLNGSLVATATTNATWNCTCTWTSQILPISSTQPFNSVVVHYDAPPPPIANPCQDYGIIFLADNMTITPEPVPIVLTNVVRLANGAFQFGFTATPNAPFTVFGATNPSLPFSNWAALVGLTEAPPGQFQFIDWQATNMTRRF